jgi:predicted lipid-binding transport protein (Tim44 family)
LYLDILIFAIIAAFLVYRLNSVLGTKQGDERPRPNPFAADPKKSPRNAPVTLNMTVKKLPLPAADLSSILDAESNKDRRVETGLEEIASADPAFDAHEFMTGAKAAFETIVGAYSKGYTAALKPLLSEKLYKDFEASLKAREAAGQTSTTEIHRIKSMKIVEAHLGGAMAYITIDYDVEQTTVTRDRAGTVIEGDPERIFNVEDVWTFTRDIRSQDPNWMLIETRAAEK